MVLVNKDFVDLVENIKAFHDLTEDSVLLVEALERFISEGNEEIAVIKVRACITSGDDSLTSELPTGYLVIKVLLILAKKTPNGVITFVENTSP